MVNLAIKNNFHVLRKNDKLNMQRFFAFVDTEANIEKKESRQYQTFQLGTSIFWDREKDVLERLHFDDVSIFWDNLLEHYSPECKKIILFAHNMGYDFRLLDGVRDLEKRGWIADHHYIKHRVFILEYKKDGNSLSIWDTYNYVQSSLEEIGKTVGKEKMGHYQDHATKRELARYCMNDTEITYLFIRKMVEFLEKHELSKLKPTIAGLSFNIFRHCFYDKKKDPIYIHDWKNTIKLERESYSGGITDCFRVGQINEMTYKLDINSMYPHIMRENPLPDRLLFYSCNPEHDLLKYYNELKKDYLVIARCKVRIPEEYAYILTSMEVGRDTKSVLTYGEMEVVKCSPELDFIEKYGEILEVKELAIYSSKNLFTGFIDFFYQKRLDYKKEGDKVNEKFCKLVLNSLYGKWAQRAMVQTELKPDDPLYIDYENMKNYAKKEGLSERDHSILDITGDKPRNCTFTELGDRVFSEEITDDNSIDSFVAIASFITSYARMLLVDYIIKAGRENVWYIDTDSLFVSEEGQKRLKSHIDQNKLGYLKVEGSSDNVQIYKPKDYVFGHERKLKGVRKGSNPLCTSEKEDVYIQDRWEGFNSAMKHGHFNVVIIDSYEKHVSKVYDKGEITKDGRIRPFKRGAENG